MKKEHEWAVKNWENSKPRVGAEPMMNINNWLMKARRLRVLSSFPRLGTLDATKELALTGTEDRSPEKQWVRRVAGSAYQLLTTGSPYKKYIKHICSSANCPKVAAIDHLIKNEWEKGEKAVFCTMGPTNALILYWVSEFLVHINIGGWRSQTWAGSCCSTDTLISTCVLSVKPTLL